MKYKVKCHIPILPSQLPKVICKCEDVVAGNWEKAIEAASLLHEDCNLFTIVGYYRGTGEYRQMKEQETYRINDDLSKTLVSKKFITIPRNRSKKKLSSKIDSLLLSDEDSNSYLPSPSPSLHTDVSEEVSSKEKRKEKGEDWDQEAWNAMFPSSVKTEEKEED